MPSQLRLLAYSSGKRIKRLDEKVGLSKDILRMGSFEYQEFYIWENQSNSERRNKKRNNNYYLRKSGNNIYIKIDFIQGNRIDSIHDQLLFPFNGRREIKVNSFGFGNKLTIRLDSERPNPCNKLDTIFLFDFSGSKFFADEFDKFESIKVPQRIEVSKCYGIISIEYLYDEKRVICYSKLFKRCKKGIP